MSNTEDIKRAVARDAAGFAAWVFPNGKRNGSKWHVGDVTGAPGKSLALELNGEFAGYFCDWSNGERGDCIALVMTARGLDFVNATRLLRERYGLVTPSHAPAGRVKPAGEPKTKATPMLNGRQPTLPKDATPGTEADWRELAALRHVSVESTCAASLLGTLLFGTVCGFRCWILTDARGLIAEARRMDGMTFPATEKIGGRKAHTLSGSVKSWPVGLMVSAYPPEADAPFLVVEGGGDYLAALHFAVKGWPDQLRWHPVAFLGAGTASEIHRDALPFLRGRQARFYPHHEASGAGEKAVSKWAEQFRAMGAGVDAFDFAGLRKADGSAVKDLNDCTRIHPDDAAELGGLLP